MRIILIVVLLGLFNAQAVHTITNADQDYINLGRRYPAVGHFSYDGTLDYASGVLVETGYPELDGRVVLTVAHNFIDRDIATVSFNSDYGSSRGQLFRHPDYKMAETVDTETGHIDNVDVNDIAIFLLDKKISRSPLAKINFDLIPSVNHSQNIVAVGYGDAGHLFNQYNIFNFNHIRRACDMILSSATQPRKKFTAQQIKDSESYMILTWFDQVSIDDQYKCMGVISRGDSGGGCFDDDDLLVGLNSMTYEVVSGILNKSVTVFDKDTHKTVKKFIPDGYDLNKLIFDDQKNIEKYFEPDLDLFKKYSLRQLESYSCAVKLSYYKDWLYDMFATLNKLSTPVKSQKKYFSFTDIKDRFFSSVL